MKYKQVKIYSVHFDNAYKDQYLFFYFVPYDYTGGVPTPMCLFTQNFQYTSPLGRYAEEKLQYYLTLKHYQMENKFFKTPTLDLACEFLPVEPAICVWAYGFFRYSLIISLYRAMCAANPEALYKKEQLVNL